MVEEFDAIRGEKRKHGQGALLQFIVGKQQAGDFALM
jgi:hypothetical protein